MKRSILFTVLLIISCSSLLAMFDDYEPSPRARGMGGAYYTTSNAPDAVFYNPAGLSLAGNGFSASTSRIFNNDFQILTAGAFSYQLPGKLGVAAIGLQAMDVKYLDVDLMSEHIYNLSHSFTLLKDIHSEIYLGYTFNIFHLDMDSFGTENELGINLGALAVLHQRTRLAFSINNINNPAFGKDNEEELPQKMAAGICYEPYPNVFTAVELKKTYGLGGSEGEKTEIHTGIEYKIHEMLSLRTGVRNNPSSFSFGLGVNVANITVDYAFNTHAVLSGTHHFGLKAKF